MAIFSHGNTHVPKVAGCLVEALFRERDLCVRFRRPVRDALEIGDPDEGVHPGVKAELAAGLSRNVADGHKQSSAVEHRFCG